MHTKKEKILLIDNEEDFAEGFKSKLKLWGTDYEVITNKTFGDITEDKFESFIIEIKEIINEFREDYVAIFLDLGLDTNPDIDAPWTVGFRLGKELRNEYYEIPFLILTQYPDRKALEDGYLYDFDSYIDKVEFSNSDSKEFHGYLLMTIKKRQAMVENLPNYYASHIQRIENAPVVFNAFGGKPFLSKGSSLERTLDSVTDFENYFSQMTRITVIMFADLVGSTNIKESSGFFEGLHITRLHNEIITQCIRDNQGTVVKYIGDCVMSRFDYESADAVNCNAINTAILIQETLDGIKRKSLHKNIQTKIGIAQGQVADFYGNDPQGICVDLAARLQSNAKADQIIVSEELIKHVKSSDISSIIGRAKRFQPNDYIKGPHQLKVKGFTDVISAYEINWNDNLLGISA